MDDHEVLAFRAICNFIKDMDDVYGDKNFPLRCYATLMERTGLVHETPIRKHIALFRSFIEENETAIFSQDDGGFSGMEIRYSEKVYINLKEIFSTADESSRSGLWSHLLTICAILRPETDAKQILKKLQEQERINSQNKASKDTTTNNPSADMFGDMFKKVFQTIGNQDLQNSNPMDMMQNIIQSGVMNDLFSQFTKCSEGGADGKSTPNLGEMFQSIQGMMNNVGTMIQEMEKKGSTDGATVSTPKTESAVIPVTDVVDDPSEKLTTTPLSTAAPNEPKVV